jgi:hypothetical protein
MFKKKFATQIDHLFITDELASIKMSPMENMRDFFSLLTQVMDIITENYDSYCNVPDQAKEDIQGGFFKTT